MAVTRRTFMKTSLATTAAATGLLGATSRVLGANEKVVVGLIGCGGRGAGHWAVPKGVV